MSKSKLWGIILFVLITLGVIIWMYSDSEVKKDVNKEGTEIMNDMTLHLNN